MRAARLAIGAAVALAAGGGAVVLAAGVTRETCALSNAIEALDVR